jgi:hypothetical protein
VAHASAKLDTRIKAAAAILATLIAIPAILPAFLFFLFGFIHSLARIMKIAPDRPFTLQRRNSG